MAGDDQLLLHPRAASGRASSAAAAGAHARSAGASGRESGEGQAAAAAAADEEEDGDCRSFYGSDGQSSSSDDEGGSSSCSSSGSGSEAGGEEGEEREQLGPLSSDSWHYGGAGAGAKGWPGLPPLLEGGPSPARRARHRGRHGQWRRGGVGGDFDSGGRAVGEIPSGPVPLFLRQRSEVGSVLEPEPHSDTEDGEAAVPSPAELAMPA